MPKYYVIFALMFALVMPAVAEEDPRSIVAAADLEYDRVFVTHDAERLSWTFRISGCVGESLGETLEKAHRYFDEFCVVPGRR